MALRSRGVGYRPQASLGSVRALLMVAPNSPPSSRAFADVNEPTVSPVGAAPRPAWLEKNCPMHEADVGATAPAGVALSRLTNKATTNSATTTKNRRACTAIAPFGAKPMQVYGPGYSSPKLRER